MRARDVLTRHLSDVYKLWHHCGLTARDARRMKLPIGRPCDVCVEQINAQVNTILAELADVCFEVTAR